MKRTVSKSEPTGGKVKVKPEATEEPPLKRARSPPSATPSDGAEGSGMPVDLQRRQVLKEAAKPLKGAVVYWMSRDQRADDNWALLYAQEMALETGAALHVVFCLLPKFPGANLRSYHFMWTGLEETARRLRDHNIPLHILWGPPATVLPAFARSHGVGLIVADFSPLRIALQWKREVGEALPDGVGLHVVDAHNVVPCWLASEKQEVGARTIRPKLWQHAKRFLTPFPALRKHPIKPEDFPEFPGLETALKNVESIDRTIGPVTWLTPGPTAARQTMSKFFTTRLKKYDKRNDPNEVALSDLSPYLHFGQIAAHRVVLEANAYKQNHSQAVQSFVEELFIRRELSDNFCFHQPFYDSLKGAAGWAQETLSVHATDKREHLYTRAQLEAFATQDDLWNAAQKQLVVQGKMHGFLRMYWAKKILEWSPTPEDALAWSIYLNDKYSLDGRDPNGYVGCMWSICGVHDMGWTERPIFGKIRYMNYAGCQRKFKVADFVRSMGVKPNPPPPKKKK